MIVLKKPLEVSEWTQDQKQRSQRIGFIPTMGYLHEGHLSLVNTARDKGACDKVIMSIFVNPTQFGPKEDFSKYPRDFERDREMAEAAGVDMLFLPESSDIYGADAYTMIEVERMSSVLCGITRPTHFRGVATVVAKLFNIVRPNVAVFGQKDAQQFFILSRMTRDLFFDIELIRAPIVREKDGLAMSSRNIYLNPDEHLQALCLSEALTLASQLIKAGERNAGVLKDCMHTCIIKRPLARIDYVEIVSTDSLEPVEELTNSVLLALAVYFGKTRLIDNVIWEMHGNIR